MLFHKIRIRLTFLSGGITTLILVIMTLGYLYISENNLMTNKILSYQNQIYTIASNLEQQTVIAHTWLSKLEGGGSYYISLLDNNVPFLFNSQQHDSTRQKLIEAIWNYYRECSASDTAMEEHILSYRSRYTGFLYEPSPLYYCFVITVEKEKTALEMLLVLPLSAMKEQIFRQRMLFLCIILIALACIWLFSWLFTGRLLYPIEENRKKQNEFIAAASHELRTPLAVILSCAEAMLEKCQDNSNLSVLVQDTSTIKSESLRMSTLLEDLLTLSSHDASQFSIQKSAVELDTLLLDTCEAFESMAHAQNIMISASLPEYSIPSCYCDKDRIRQVLAILLHNAISYTPKKGKISLLLTYQKEQFLLSVSDTGPGIPDEEKDKIFDRFYRSERSRSTKGHFGLGLSIAYEIATAHHGSIKVSDNPSGGATFTLSLPSNDKA